MDAIHIPDRLQELLAAGVWPSNEDAVREQNIDPIVTPAQVARLAAGEETLALLAPPFRTVAQRINDGDTFWTVDAGAAAHRNPEQVLVIADFGPGSDPPIALDYSVTPGDPRVILLAWSDGISCSTPRWAELSPSFNQFCDVLGL